MGYERGGRTGNRDDENSRQQRQDYDRSYGGRSYGGDQPRADYGRSDYGRSDYGRGDQGRGDYGRGSQGRYGRDDRGRDYGRQPQGYDYDDRGFFDRAGDEVRSWFGDEEAERRRQLDERHEEREYRARYADGTRNANDARALGNRDYGQRDARYGRDSRDDGYGRGRGGQRDSGIVDSGAAARGRNYPDPYYHAWRDRQIAALDSDYEDYRDEHQATFDDHFHGWRSNRQTQRDSLKRVQEHQEVVGSDGQHVGTVDKVRGDQIILTKQDQDAHGRHHAIPSAWIQTVDERVTIRKTADQAKAHWRDADNNSAFWNNAEQEPGFTRTAQAVSSSINNS